MIEITKGKISLVACDDLPDIPCGWRGDTHLHLVVIQTKIILVVRDKVQARSYLGIVGNLTAAERENAVKAVEDIPPDILPEETEQRRSAIIR